MNQLWVCVCVFPFCRFLFPYMPLQNIEFPVLCSRSFVSVLYVVACICASYSPSFFPPHLLPVNHKFVFYIYNFLFLKISSFVSFKIPHISVIALFVCLTSLSMTISSLSMSISVWQLHSVWQQPSILLQMA